MISVDYYLVLGSTTTTTVVDQSIDSFLSIRFSFCTMIPGAFNLSKRANGCSKDHTTVRVVQVAAAKRLPKPFIGRRSVEYREDVENHPFWLVTRFVEGIQNIQTANSSSHAFDQLQSQFFTAISASKSTCFKRSDRFCPHLGNKGTWSVFTQAFTVFTFGHRLVLAGIFGSITT